MQLCWTCQRCGCADEANPSAASPGCSPGRSRSPFAQRCLLHRRVSLWPTGRRGAWLGERERERGSGRTAAAASCDVDRDGRAVPCALSLPARGNGGRPHRAAAGLGQEALTREAPPLPIGTRLAATEKNNAARAAQQLRAGMRAAGQPGPVLSLNGKSAYRTASSSSCAGAGLGRRFTLAAPPAALIFGKVPTLLTLHSRHPMAAIAIDSHRYLTPHWSVLMLERKTEPENRAPALSWASCL